MKEPVFYCQLDYDDVPYVSPVSLGGTIANNGCGVCSASMIAENLLGVSFPPQESAKLAKACGAREGYGTNLYIYAPAFAKAFGLTCVDTEDAGEALRFLNEGKGMVIANVQGNREGYTGVFSDSGHYIALLSAKGSEVAVLDPMYRQGSGRFDVEGRRGKVRLDGNVAYADMSVIAQDCHERPFFLFSKPEQNKNSPGA